MRRESARETTLVESTASSLTLCCHELQGWEVEGAGWAWAAEPALQPSLTGPRGLPWQPAHLPVKAVPTKSESVVLV